MDNVSNISSSRNISNILVANGTETNYKTVGSYIDHLCHAFVFYEARRYDVRVRPIFSRSVNTILQIPAFVLRYLANVIWTGAYA